MYIMIMQQLHARDNESLKHKEGKTDKCLDNILIK